MKINVLMKESVFERNIVLFCSALNALIKKEKQERIVEREFL